MRRDHVDPDSGNALAAAFMRRREVDVEGLSVSLAQQRTAEEVAANERETVVIQRRCLRAARNLKTGAVLGREDLELLLS